MKKIIFALILLSLSQSSFAQKVTLSCKGWVPVYKTFSSRPENMGSENDSMLVDLDMSTRMVKFLTQLGETNTEFKGDGSFYWGKAEVNRVALGKFVTSIDLSINRLDGNTHISYSFQDEPGGGRVAFMGTCIPAKPMF